jgi:hypothetical protein
VSEVSCLRATRSKCRKDIPFPQPFLCVSHPRLSSCSLQVSRKPENKKAFSVPSGSAFFCEIVFLSLVARPPSFPFPNVFIKVHIASQWHPITVLCDKPTYTHRRHHQDPRARSPFGYRTTHTRSWFRGSSITTEPSGESLILCQIVKERQMEFDTETDPDFMYELFGEDVHSLAEYVHSRDHQANRFLISVSATSASF